MGIKNLRYFNFIAAKYIFLKINPNQSMQIFADLCRFFFKFTAGGISNCSAKAFSFLPNALETKVGFGVAIFPKPS